MKIKSIHLKYFKRFTDLKIEEIPETARLVVMIGPNGCGKSSVFDALLKIKIEKEELHTSSFDTYYKKFGLSKEDYREPEVEFHTPRPTTKEDWNQYVHVRSAYRNDLLNDRNTVRLSPGIVHERRCSRLSNNDEAVGINYLRLLSQWIERSSTGGKPSETIGKLQSEIFGQLRDTIQELFRDPQLVLSNLGAPVYNKIFEFNKGASHGFSYHNLSSGEKAVLDLILDIMVVKAEFSDTVFCIDEPEAHIHTKLQGPLLEKLYSLIPNNSQLWIATHAVGMVRKAQDLWRDDPDSVVFLDFGEHDFDEEVTITPAEPNPNFWAQTYEVALGDLAELVITGRTVFCEGEGFDEECYKNIFKNQYPEIHFTSLGGRENVVKSVTATNLAIGKIAKSAKVIGIVDRDRATMEEIKRDTEKGIRTLSRKSIESYLLDDEVLTKLCEYHGADDKINDLLTAKQDALKKNKLKSSDNLKSIVQPIHGAAQKILKSANLGNTRESFMMDVLAPRIQAGMKVYEELHKDIFDE